MKYIRQAWRISRLPKILRRPLLRSAVWRPSSVVLFHRPSFYGIPLLLASALALFSATDFDRASESDTDSDGMSDAFEQFYRLDYLDSRDALVDYDGDHLLHAREAVLGTDPFAPDTDRDGMTDDLDIVNPISRAYIQWGSPWFTDGDDYDYARPDYFLGAWKDGGDWFSTFVKPEAGRVMMKSAELSTQSGWHAASMESNVVESLNLALDRGILTNNLVYAIHYWDSAQASLFVDLLDTNAAIVIEDLYGNLMEGTNAEAVVLLAVPTASFTNAAVIQLRRGTGKVVVYEGLVYIDEDGDGLDADQERQLGTSDYNVDSNGDRIGDYEEYFHKTNNVVPIKPDVDDDEDVDDDGDKDKDKTGIIYVDQALGNDTFTGRASAISGKKKGPKKTIHNGMAAVDADAAHTLIIKSGVYNENLDLRGKNVKVVIEGNVKL